MNRQQSSALYSTVESAYRTVHYRTCVNTIMRIPRRPCTMDDLQPNVRVLGECCPRRRVQCGCPYFGAVVGSKFEVFSFSYFSHIL